ncbi:hypothetical protein HMPREF9069_00554 [Atopobium sp. oral taxon 810 str. F0209]|nr:hypothetical protein HMPREF9069_00554 [Atopobium sp. oral taxon 810 str. F0209]
MTAAIITSFSLPHCVHTHCAIRDVYWHRMHTASIHIAYTHNLARISQNLISHGEHFLRFDTTWAAIKYQNCKQSSNNADKTYTANKRRCTLFSLNTSSCNVVAIKNTSLPAYLPRTVKHDRSQ